MTVEERNHDCFSVAPSLVTVSYYLVLFPWQKKGRFAFVNLDGTS